MGEEGFAQYLRRIRRERGLTQEDLADTAGISANYIAKLETGMREPGLKVIKRLSNALHVPKDEILDAIIHTWPDVTALEPRQEFSEFGEGIQDFLVEVGYLVQKHFQFRSKDPYNF